MKLNQATPILLGLATVPSANANRASPVTTANTKHDFATKLIVGLHELKKHSKAHPSRELQVDDGFFNTATGELQCPETCTSQETCDIFQGNINEGDNSTAFLEEACNAGFISECAPSSLQTTCDAICIADDLGFLGDLICGPCKFIDCCGSEGNFDSCQGLLPDEDVLGMDGPEVDWGWGTENGTEGVAGGWAWDDDENSTSFFGDWGADSNGTDDFLSGIIGGMLDENNTFGNGTDDFLSGIIGGIFGAEGNNTFGNGTDDFFGGIIDEIFGAEGSNWTLDGPASIAIEGGAGNASWSGGEDSASGSWLDSEEGLIDLIPGFAELLANASATAVEICSQDNACPVDGFCECLNGDITRCDINLVEDVCATGSFFSCYDGFEDMCNSQCSESSSEAPPRHLRQLEEDDDVNEAICSMCDLAECCNSGGATIDECINEVFFGGVKDELTTSTNPTIDTSATEPTPPTTDGSSPGVTTDTVTEEDSDVSKAVEPDSSVAMLSLTSTSVVFSVIATMVVML
ncbi:predicted protein [Thalassiosira pseudonana CCMP1335]|jgi:hypothetical protein|uniref:Uncharacterized protein n=1 Tax=Thalassiosira pseudonana TaxID=35128 RepID=B8C4Y7_THAPS|nr:predicted protein [Thalassiosira pseudonana CCMP1335]EED91025.1 predicted protein [Thalassiosira pseudonana CCMP1335]|eukprot:scaffold85_cov145-Alexandrium_tamarense.AAC.68